MTGGEKNGRPLRLGLLTARASRLGGGVFEAVLAEAQALAARGDVTPIVFGGADQFTAEDRKRLDGIELITRPEPRSGRLRLRAGPSGAAPCRRIGRPASAWHLAICLALRRAVGRADGTPLCDLAAWDARPLDYGARTLEKDAGAPRLRAAQLARCAAFPRPDRIRGGGYRTRNGRRARPHRGRAELCRHGRKRHPRPGRSLCSTSGASTRRRISNRSLMAGSPPGLPRPAIVLPLPAGASRRMWPLCRPSLRQAPIRSISFLGPVYGEQKHHLLHEARFVILPSLSEGLPMAILEAWAAATPTLMSAACNLPEGFSAGAALDTGIAADSIAGALRRALAMPEPDWQSMSAAAQWLARTRFSAGVGRGAMGRDLSRARGRGIR